MKSCSGCGELLNEERPNEIHEVGFSVETEFGSKLLTQWQCDDCATGL